MKYILRKTKNSIVFIYYITIILITLPYKNSCKLRDTIFLRVPFKYFGAKLKP